MGRKITYGLVLAATLLLLACARHGERFDQPRTVQILSTVSGTTPSQAPSKALAEQSTPLAAVRLLQTHGATPTSLAGATPFLANRTAVGNINWTDNVPIYDKGGRNAYFVAYHPQGTETPNTQTDWPIDGKTDILLSAPWDAGSATAPKTGSGAGETPLTFRHLLAQLAVVVKAEAGADYAQLQRQYGKITSVKLTQTLPTATYTYATNAVTFGGTPTETALWQADCQTAFAPIAVPESTNAAINAGGLFAPGAGAFTVVVTTENYAAIPVAVQLTGTGGNKNFEAGLKHTVTITFKADRAELVVSGCSIVDWTAEYTAGSDVEI